MKLRHKLKPEASRGGRIWPSGRITTTFRMVGDWPAPKGYSPTRRWLRAERAREHQEALDTGSYSEMPVRRINDGEIEHVIRFVGFGRFG